jgi:hypothetical protein
MHIHSQSCQVWPGAGLAAIACHIMMLVALNFALK